MNEINYYLKLKYFSMKKLKCMVNQVRDDLPVNKRFEITYSRNFTLSLSNFCKNFCSYCYYNHRIPKRENIKNIELLDEKHIDETIKLAKQLNCKEGLIVSGEKPDDFPIVRKKLKERGYENYLEFVVHVCKKLLKSSILPHTNIGNLSFKELELLKEYNASMGLMLESTSSKLMKKGKVHFNSPSKFPNNRLNHIENAGRLKIPFTTGLLIGIGENFKDRIKDLILIRELNEKYGHIQEVIIQNFVFKEGINYKPKKPINIKDMLKLVGIARIIFQNEIAIQVPPNLINGHERNFLEMGIDDFGGISPLTLDYINPDKSWPQIKHLENICLENGYFLKERLPIYDKFIKKEGFVSETIKKTLDVFK